MRCSSKTKVIVTPCIMFIGFDEPAEIEDKNAKKWKFKNLQGIKGQTKSVKRKPQQKVKRETPIHEKATAWEELTRGINSTYVPPYEMNAANSCFFEQNKDYMAADFYLNDQQFKTYWNSLHKPKEAFRGRELSFGGSNSSTSNGGGQSIISMERKFFALHKNSKGAYL